MSSSSSSPSSLSSLQLWFLPELKRAFPLAEDWLLDGLSQTCVASRSVEEMCDAMRNFIGEEEAVAEALRLSEMLFEKKKEYQEEEKKTNSPSSSSFRDDGELKLRKVKEKTKTTSDGGKEEDQKKGEAKAYRKYDSIEKPSRTNDQTSSKAIHSVVREHRSILVKMSKKKSSSAEDVGKRKDRMKNPGGIRFFPEISKPG